MISKRPIKSAWVLFQDGTRHDIEVLSIFSARKTPNTIKEYLEWLFALLHCHPDTHVAAAKYTKPEVPCKAEFDITNIGVPRQSIIRCGYNPYLTAVMAKNVSLVEREGQPSYLRWTMPDRISWDRDTLDRKETLPGVTLTAPMNVPLTRNRKDDEVAQ